MLTIESASNPVFGNSEKNLITLLVKFVEYDDILPFGASANDSMPYGVELFNRAMAGEFGLVAPYVEPEILPQPQTQGAQTL